MSRKYPTFIEHHFERAEELWLALSPTHQLREGPVNFVYRGQGNARWGLIPSILRSINKPLMADASQMVHHELIILCRFADHCDSLGIPIPNDSQEFRRLALNHQKADRYYRTPSLWPNPDLRDLMAMAQHHGVPTRLLDWTTKAYTAAYFAASSALSNFEAWQADDRLAIWALDQGVLGLHDQIVLHRSPGAVSRHLAAQGGLFTVHPHSGERGCPFTVVGLEELSLDIDHTPFVKLTLPVYESAELLRICAMAGFNAAMLYPTADGVGKAVIDDLNMESAREKWNVSSILVR